MGERFEAIGLSLPNTAARDQLVEYVDTTGTRSSIYRRGAFIHGRCLHLGDGLEVWAVLYETSKGLFCADCRPAFRSTRVYSVSPWELAEIDEEGGAILNGQLFGTKERVALELQNLTELDPRVFRQSSLNISLAGLAYRCRISKQAREPKMALINNDTENDYSITGPVVDFRMLRNRLSGGDIVVADVDIGLMNLEIVINMNDLREQPKIGSILSARIWLQGYVLDERLLNIRYEGVDRDISLAQHWSMLKREN